MLGACCARCFVRLQHCLLYRETFSPRGESGDFSRSSKAIDDEPLTDFSLFRFCPVTVSSASSFSLVIEFRRHTIFFFTKYVEFIECSV